MKFTKSEIPDVVIVEPRLFNDDRGCFYESFSQEKFEKNVVKTSFIQDNESKSTYGVLRGLHYQLPPFSQAKLIRVLKGEILDFAVDIRKGSPTFGKHIKVRLSSDNKKQLFIPRGFAHGFVVLSSSATLSYKVDAYYAAKHNEGIAYNDPDININWGFSEADIILSEADKNYPTLANSDKLF